MRDREIIESFEACMRNGNLDHMTYDLYNHFHMYAGLHSERDMGEFRTVYGDVGFIDLLFHFYAPSFEHYTRPMDDSWSSSRVAHINQTMREFVVNNMQKIESAYEENLLNSIKTIDLL